MIHSTGPTFRNRLQAPAGTFRNMMRGGKIGCSPGANCCSDCAGHLGDASDTTDFTDFLAANPDLQVQQLAYQQANPGDPALQTVMFNPVTNTMGPVALPPASSGPAIPAAAAGSSTGLLLIAGAIVAGFILMQSIEGGTTSTGTRKRR